MTIDGIFDGESAGSVRSKLNRSLAGQHDSLASARSAVIPLDVKALRVLGFYYAGDGGNALYLRASSQPPHPGKFRSADGSWWELAADEPNIKMFGAVGDGKTDDTNAIDRADLYCRTYRPGLVLPLEVPVGVFRRTSPFALHTGIHLLGSGGKTAEFDGRSKIINSATAMFSLQSDIRDVYISGITFQGHSQGLKPCFPAVDAASGAIIKYSTIEHCGFKYFSYVFKSRILGCKILNNYINDSERCLEIYGSDNIIANNFIGGFGKIPLSKDPTVVDISHLALSRIQNNFITGMPAIPMRVSGDCEGLVLASNWFDYTDGSGLYFKNATGGIAVVSNTFRKCLAAPYPPHFGVVTAESSNDIGFTSNMFLEQNVGDITYALSGMSGICIVGNIYKRPYKRIVALSAGAEAPFIAEV